MRKILGITGNDILTRGDMIRLKIFRHPHRNVNKNFAHSLPLLRRVNFEDTKWLNANTTAPYSLDNGSHVSFQNANDAMKIKLMRWGDLIGIKS